MATMTPDSSNQKATNLADEPFLIAMGFKFDFTTWAELSALAIQAADEARSLHLHMYDLFDARINKEVLSGDTMHEHATSFFLEEFNKLEEKLMGLVQLLNEVDDAACRQSGLIRMAMRPGEDECDVESLFSPGTKICFRPEGRFDWFFG